MFVDPGIVDLEGSNAEKIARASGKGQDGVALYLSRVAKVRTKNQEVAAERKRCCLGFYDSSKEGGGKPIPYGTREYEDALVRLAEVEPSFFGTGHSWHG